MTQSGQACTGCDKTIEKVSRHFYWKGMTNYIKKYCEKCLVCLSIKDPKHPSKSPLGNIQCSGPWELVCVDLVKMPTSQEGMKYILTVICGFLKFAFALAVPSKKAQVIAQVWIDRVFSVFGFPRQLHSDRGKEFVNEVLKEMLAVLGVKQSLTTAYHPQGNAYAERIHRFFKHAISQHTLTKDMMIGLHCYGQSY